MSQSPQAARDETDARAELERLELDITRHTDEGDAAAAAALHFRAAQICLARGDADPRSRESGLTHLWASWQLQPEDLDVRTTLAYFLERDAQLDQTANLLRSTAQHLTREKERTGLLLRAADLLREVGELDEALLVLRGLSRPKDPELGRHRARSLRALVAALERAGSAEHRAEALELLRPELGGDELFRALLDSARLHEQLGNPTEAQRAYRDALAVRPADPAALDPVRQHLAGEQTRDELVEVLEGAVRASVSPAQQVVLLRELAQIAETGLSDLARSARYLWRAWELNASAPEAERLKRLYTELEDWHQYRRVLEREAFATLDADAKVRAYRELAALQRRVFDDDLGAARTFGCILHLVPGDEEALAARVEIFEELGRPEELRAALRRFASQVRDPARRAQILRRLARLEHGLPTSGYLLRTLGRLDPRDPENRSLVRELAAQTAQRPALALELGARLMQMERQAGTAGPECATLAFELGEQATRAGETGRAAECFRQALELDPERADARARLDALVAQGAPVEPSAADLAAEAERLAPQDPARAVRLWVRAAQLARHHGGDPRVEQEHLRRALAHCPAGAAPELALLEEALSVAGLFQDLAGLLERESQTEDALPRRKDILRALAYLYRDELGDPTRAAEALDRALEIDPGDVEVNQDVRRLHAQLGNHKALAAVLENLLGRTSGAERIPLLRELGQLYAERLQDHGTALARHGELLALVPADPTALAYCRAHDESNGNYRSVAVLLCRAAEALEEPLARAELHREIARIAEQRLADPDFAVAQWRQVVDLCPADAAPRAELKRLLYQVGRWADVERVLLSEVSRSLRPDEKVPVYFELARLATEHTRDDRRAASYLRNALQLAPENREALVQLQAVYERLGQWRELSGVLKRHAEVEPDADEKHRLLHRAARVLFVHLGREEEALAICRMLHESRPADRAAATLMGEIYAKRGKWWEKAAVLREQISSETDPPELGRLHLDLGRLLLDKLDDPEGAATHFELALELASAGAEILPRLRQLYEALGRWDLLVDLIRRRAAAEHISTGERALALCEIGRIKEQHLGDPAGAKEAYERAIHLDPTHRPALAALRALASGRDQWRDLVALARRELQLTEDAVERSRLLVEIGEIQFRQLERPSAAAEALEEALESDPSNSRAAHLLGMIYFETEDWERAGQFLEKIIASGIELENVHEYHFRLGYAAEKLGREDEAFSHYVKSFGREPMYLPTLTRLVDLCYTRNQWDNTLRIAEAIVSTYADQKTPQELADLYLRIGLSEIHIAQRDVAVKKLQDMLLEHGQVPTAPAEAWVDAAESWAATPLEPSLLALLHPDVLGRVVKAMERALVHVASHPGALQVLAALSITRRDWERSLRYIDRTVEVAGERRLQVGLLVCAGDVALRHLLSAQRAKSYYRRALEIMPGSDLVRDRLDMVEVTPARGVEAPPPVPPPTDPGVGRAIPPPPPTTQGTVRAAPPPPPTTQGTVRAAPPPLPVPTPLANGRPAPPPVPGPIPAEPSGELRAPLMPPIPGDDVVEEAEPAPPVTRPAPRSRPRRPDEG